MMVADLIWVKPLPSRRSYLLGCFCYALMGLAWKGSHPSSYWCLVAVRRGADLIMSTYFVRCPGTWLMQGCGWCFRAAGMYTYVYIYIHMDVHRRIKAYMGSWKTHCIINCGVWHTGSGKQGYRQFFFCLETGATPKVLGRTGGRPSLMTFPKVPGTCFWWKPRPKMRSEKFRGLPGTYPEDR